MTNLPKVEHFCQFFKKKSAKAGRLAGEPSIRPWPRFDPGRLGHTLAMAMLFRRGDQVLVVAGEHNGRSGIVSGTGGRHATPSKGFSPATGCKELMPSRVLVQPRRRPLSSATAGRCVTQGHTGCRGIDALACTAQHHPRRRATTRGTRSASAGACTDVHAHNQKCTRVRAYSVETGRRELSLRDLSSRFQLHPPKTPLPCDMHARAHRPAAHPCHTHGARTRVLGARHVHGTRTARVRDGAG